MAHEETNEPILVDVNGACRLLGGVSPRWLWGQTEPRGPIPTVPMGTRRVLYRLDDLKKYVRNRMAKAKSKRVSS